MKKLFLIFLLLFTPISAYTDGGTVITSSDQLTEKILPLDTDIFAKAHEKTFGDELYAHCGVGVEEFVNQVLEGNLTIPFSIKEFTGTCKKTVSFTFHGAATCCYSKEKGWDNQKLEQEKKACKNGYYCTNFALTYMQLIAEKAQEPVGGKASSQYPIPFYQSNYTLKK